MQANIRQKTLPEEIAVKNEPKSSRSSSLRSHDLAALYEQTCQGDRGAVDGLYESLKDLVWWTIRNAGVTGADAEDVFQATWTKFFEHLGKHRDPSAIKAWLVAVARNKCIDIGRVSGRTVPVEALMIVEADELPPDEAAIHALDVEALDVVMGDLSDRERQVVALWAHGASYKEMDSAIGIPVGSVGPTLVRSRQKLAKALRNGDARPSIGISG